MATYRVRSGESIYDIAAVLYKDTALGIQDLLSLNPTVDLDASELFGISLEYTSGLKRTKPVFDNVPVSPQITSYKTLTKQSVYDLSIQLYGDISQIRNLLELFPNLNELITVGSEVEVSEQSDPIAVFFTDRNLKVSTDIEQQVAETVTFDSSIAKWDSTVYTFDQT